MKEPTQFTYRLAFLACKLALPAIIAVAVPPAHAVPLVFNAAADFSLTSNPNGVWSYGSKNSLGSSLQLFDMRLIDSVGIPGLETPGLEGWSVSQPDAQGNLDPVVIFNSTNSDIAFSSAVVPSKGLMFHPGLEGEFAVIRWTAPTEGSYDLTVAFRGDDFVGPTSTDVFVMHDNGLLFSGGVNAFGPGPSFTSVLPVQAGDTIDFLVGVGQNGNYFNDSTGISATLSAVPEPSSLALLGLGLLALWPGSRGRGRRPR